MLELVIRVKESKGIDLNKEDEEKKKGWCC